MATSLSIVAQEILKAIRAGHDSPDNSQKDVDEQIDDPKAAATSPEMRLPSAS